MFTGQQQQDGQNHAMEIGGLQRRDNGQNHNLDNSKNQDHGRPNKPTKPARQNTVDVSTQIADAVNNGDVTKLRLLLKVRDTPYHSRLL